MTLTFNKKRLTKWRAMKGNTLRCCYEFDNPTRRVDEHIGPLPREPRGMDRIYFHLHNDRLVILWIQNQ